VQAASAAAGARAAGLKPARLPALAA